MRRKDGTICGAKAGADHHPCLNPPVAGRERCHLHGGAQKRGMERSNWKGGSIRSDRAKPTLRIDRVSMTLPRRLSERFEQAVNDPALLELRTDIALVDTRLEELLALVDADGAGAAWDRVGLAFTVFCAQRYTDKEPAAFADLEDAIEAGSTDRERWLEIVGLLDQRRKLVESERKRLVETNQMLTAEAAMNLFATLAAAVRRHVHDEDALRSIDAEFKVLVNLPELPHADHS